MDLTALPTQLPQSSNTTDAHSDHAYDTMRNHTAVNETLEDSAPSTISSIDDVLAVDKQARELADSLIKKLM